MPRFKLTIEYDGGPFAGWQRQANGLSVQEVIETALEALCGERVSIRGAGRTDAGVHALGQAAHADLARDWPSDVLRDGLNAHLRPHPVAVLWAQSVPNSFDARFSAIRRHYLYRIVNRRAPLTVARGRAWLVKRKLDAAAMAAAARHLIGKHDFSTFRSSECQALNPVRTLERLDVAREGEEIRIIASARSFLHTQMRSIAGSLQHVGTGKWSVDDFISARDACDRRRCGVIAPPEGLYLTGVDYGGADEGPAVELEDRQRAFLAGTRTS
ncbi:MAG: tRNA pseudouridine(38-40) synthase TruA [Beijerinckiaceae bacterium]|nr:tRNA pseudouridine(38-40) synthase TruA [Beijerinckiaceae bacterium]